jgi:hypothetical protein
MGRREGKGCSSLHGAVFEKDCGGQCSVAKGGSRLLSQSIGSNMRDASRRCVSSQVVLIGC